MNTYIILSAGKGVKLQPLTLNHPKSLFKLDDKTTILQRLVRKIREYDAEAEIVVVVGYMYKQIQKELEDAFNIKLNILWMLTTHILNFKHDFKKYVDSQNKK